MTNLTNDQVRAYLVTPPGAAVATALAAIEQAETCPRCDGTRIEIVRVPDINSRVGFRQEARRCDHKPVQPIHDGKMAAAGGDV
jgi:hypothetical protein